MGNYYVGLDLGQCHDYTALAAIERVELWGEYDPVMIAHRKEIALRLRHLERIPLKTPYPDVVERTGTFIRSLCNQAASEGAHCELLVDATGVGRPVLDMLRSADLPCRLTPVLVTGGHRESFSNGHLHVPKKDIVSVLQIALQQKMLRIAEGMDYSRELVKELTDMRVRVTTTTEQYGAWREGTHDDLVFAVALGCLGARKRNPKDTSGEQQYWCGLKRIMVN